MEKRRRASKNVQKSLTRTEARKFRARWKSVNTAERTELQLTPLDQKLRQLAALMASSEAMGWKEVLASEEA